MGKNMYVNIYNNKKFGEEVIAWFPLIRHGPHKKQKELRSVTQRAQMDTQSDSRMVS
jgi:hypothetical protein